MIIAVSSTIRVITKYFCTRKETKTYSRQLEIQNTIPNTVYPQYALQAIKLLSEQFVKA